MDIVERLRSRKEYDYKPVFIKFSRSWGTEATPKPDADCREAADEIEALRAEVERLREADKIVRDLIAEPNWRHPRNDIYPRMVKYVRSAALAEKDKG